MPGIRKAYEQISRVSRTNPLLKKIVRNLSYIQIAWYSRLDDKAFAQLMYKKYNGEHLDLENPVTFNEKLWWLKYHYRNPLEKICSDKYRVREYMHQCGLDNLLVELYGVYDRPEDIPLETFKQEVFIKLNVGTGGNILYSPGQAFDKKMFYWDFNSRKNHNHFNNMREWNFKDVPAKIICEKVLRDEDGKLPKDWKFMCFGGEPKLLFYSSGACDETGRHSANGERYTNVYDMNFNFVPIKSSYPMRPDIIVEKPDTFELMKKYAALLSSPFPHCRVDFYSVKGNVYIGEITFYHSGGCGNITPREWAEKMGNWIDLDSIPNKFIV